MSRVVVSPPETEVRADGTMAGGWWHEKDEAGRIVCDLCPRACSLKPGDRGFCFVRENRDGQMVLATYGRSTGFCIDPIEKKPLNHFYPGTSVLSFGTAGCNLGCKFCQNWDISKSREVARLSEQATPEMIAEAAGQLGCRSVAYTYNDPVIWAEYAIDTARACRAVGVRSVAVTAGYITPEAREPFFHAMDAANVDLKAFSEQFYHQLTYSHLQPVLNTLRWLKHESDVWFEITNLVIPDQNDSPDELRRMCDWILENVGPDVPVHFSAFHPDFRMQDLPPTPPPTLQMARRIALEQGIHYAYVGNVDDVTNQSTYCPNCQGLLIERNWYDLGVYHLQGNRCRHCGAEIAGRFDQQPGTWGHKRQPVRISQFLQATRPPQGRPREEQSMTEPANNLAASAATNVPHIPELTGQQEAAIHRAACEIVAAGVLGRQPVLSDPELDGCAGASVMGAFVTLKRHGRLRACCGSLGQPMPIRDALQQAALRTATADSRFPTISATELEHLHLDVSLLYAFQPVQARGRARVEEVQVGRHGLQIRRGSSAGLLLPVVATEQGWDAEEFLAHVCRKAGLPSTAWLDDDAQLVKFEGHLIEGDFDAGVLSELQHQRSPRFSPQDLRQLADQCRTNVLALATGATPNYYLAGCPDGSVEAAALSLRVGDQQQPSAFSQMSLRPGLPLQTTLFKLCEAAAATLQRLRINRRDLEGVRVDLTVLDDPAMHGVVAEPDLGGVDPANRALLVVDHGKTAWVFDPQKTPEDLLHAATEAAEVSNPSIASVFSLAAHSTETSLVVSSVPRPQVGPEARAAAVAGKFYPGEPDEMAKMLEEMLADDAEPGDWPAVLVPHAGWIYSGRLAAATLQRVRIPETVIIIAPKHSRFGSEWAVAPHRIWEVPGGSLPSDPELARRLAEAIPGLELDAAAHQYEHAIEVQLPILARLAPGTRVVGITVGAGDMKRCREFAEGLAGVLRELDPRPLLIISSDMNHFASDEENRRLDAIALDAVQSLDPAAVYDTVVSRHNISMCGVRPAVMVMETLRQLGQLDKCERVGYATSGDVSGDKNRVVGYAGLLFG
jgi:AmmeMemoRadiSam system radical SAM enzyme/AmmeMemoRadiSam system protein B/AmmeMemoRadiSam system protein A